jgi:glucokinase
MGKEQVISPHFSCFLAGMAGDIVLQFNKKRGVILSGQKPPKVLLSQQKHSHG